jgi:hypothetical protein
MTHPETTDPPKRRGHWMQAHLPLALMIFYVVLAAALIVVRALVGPLNFLSVGWIMLLALVPLLPWLIPALAPAARDIAPFVRQVRLPGGFEIALDAAERPVSEPGHVQATLTDDHLVYGITSTTTPFTTTDAQKVIEGVQKVRQSGAEAILLELGNGSTWRLPNLYFVAWILANDPGTLSDALSMRRRPTLSTLQAKSASP